MPLETGPGPSQEENVIPGAPDSKEIDSEDARKKRLTTLKALRQVFVDCGYGEIVAPYYSIEDDKSSDIVLETNTFDQGIMKATISLSGEVSIRTAFNLADWSPSTSRNQLARELMRIKESILKADPDADINFSDSSGARYDIPEIAKIKPKEPDSGPPKVPLQEQDVHYDPQRGIWYGTPKKGE